MAFNFVALMHPDMVRIVQKQPIEAMLTGGMEKVDDLAGLTARARKNLNMKAAIAKAIKNDAEQDKMILTAGAVAKAKQEKEAKIVHPRPYASYPAKSIAKMPSSEKRNALAYLQGMVDPASTVVVTGYAEVGPWGDAASRWEMERDGEFSLEGCVLMAWMLGFIKYFNGPQPNPSGAGPPVHYSGWVDKATGKPVSHTDVKSKYEEQILTRCGLRILDPAVLGGFDGTNTMHHHTVMLEEDLPPIEIDDMDMAKEFARQHGEFADISESASGVLSLKMKKGAKIYVPRSLRTDRWVCSQVPSGWDAKHFGIPDDIIAQVDRVTLYALVSCAEALRESGVMDPYEFYEYVHLSHVGNAIGSGMGGIQHLKDMFVNRYHTDAKAVQGDVLQETFINTTAAWVNMLMLSSSGPIKTPVGACATAMESAAIAVDTILCGQAKVMLVGAVDDLDETSIAEFASMKATASADVDKARGRVPDELSRPMSQTRSGFVESHGAGVLVFMSGDLALAMGAPIHAVVGMVHTATDGLGRSVPAPGKGILGSVSESAGPPSPLLDMEMRRGLLESELKSIRAMNLPAEEKERFVGLARRRWSVDWWRTDPGMSPLRGALSVFGLTADDITVASCHGTSTKLNDLNETAVVQQQMEVLGRSSGNPLYIISQKWITGHPKGPAAAWQMNGVIQAMADEVIPGNRNLDCVDPELRTRKHLFFTNESIHRQPVTAGVINSFGFGQAGGQCLLIHSDYFLASIDDDSFSKYTQRVVERDHRIFKQRQDIFGGRVSFVPIKAPEATPHSEPYPKAVLNKDVRRPKTMTVAPDTGAPMEFKPQARTAPSAPGMEAVGLALQAVSAGKGPSKAMGIDAEPVRPFEASFLERNFSAKERADIEQRDLNTGTKRTASGLWSAKEAVVKALGNAGAQLGAASQPLNDIELHREEGGSLRVELKGSALAAAQKVKATDMHVSVTYAADTAYAAAIVV
jgi:phosphopantetheine--protein transferase-like protein